MDSFRVHDSIPGAGIQVPLAQVLSRDHLQISRLKQKIDAPDPNLEPSCQSFTSGIEEGEIDLRPHTDKVKAKVDTNNVSVSLFQVYQQNSEKLITRMDLTQPSVGLM